MKYIDAGMVVADGVLEYNGNGIGDAAARMERLMSGDNGDTSLPADWYCCYGCYWAGNDGTGSLSADLEIAEPWRRWGILLIVLAGAQSGEALLCELDQGLNGAHEATPKLVGVEDDEIEREDWDEDEDAAAAAAVDDVALGKVIFGDGEEYDPHCSPMSAGSEVDDLPA